MELIFEVTKVEASTTDQGVMDTSQLGNMVKNNILKPLPFRVL